MQVPLRTCIGCRKKAPQSELLRVAIHAEHPGSPPQATLDAGRRHPGRGAWIHPDSECIRHAKRSKAVARSARRAVDTAELFAQLEQKFPENNRQPVNESGSER